jgi:trimethylamine--corrinoid protein Co-methyltransferase
MKVKMEVLNRNELDTIYQTALDILEKIGVNIEDDEIVQLLINNGCKSDPGNILYFPEKLIEKCLKSTPNRNTETLLCGRDPSQDMRIEKNQTNPYVLSHVLMNYFDAPTNTYRVLTKEDIKKFVTVSDFLNSIDGVWMCTLMPEFKKMYSYCEYELAIRSTTKPVCISSFEPVAIPPTLELAAALAGGEGELRNRPLTVAFCEISPLTWNKYGCDMLKATARTGIQPVITVETPMGDTGPSTFAGNIAQKIAELLSGLVIVQLLREGLSVLFVVPLEVFDMRTAQISLASRGDYVWACCVGQLEEYLGIPIISPISPDSKLLDMQEAYELSFSFLPRILGGNKATVIHGLDQTHAINNELLLLMDDMIISARRVLEGIDVTEETLAFDVLAEVAKKVEKNRRTGHFLNQKHTLKWYVREHVPRRDGIIDKYNREKWIEGGSKSFVQRAHEKVEEILKSHEPEPLTREIESAIDEIHKKYNIPHLSTGS